MLIEFLDGQIILQALDHVCSMLSVCKKIYNAVVTFFTTPVYNNETLNADYRVRKKRTSSCQKLT